MYDVVDALSGHPLFVGTIIQIFLDNFLKDFVPAFPHLLYENMAFFKIIITILTFDLLHACISSTCTYFYGVVYGTK